MLTHKIFRNILSEKYSKCSNVIVNHDFLLWGICYAHEKSEEGEKVLLGDTIDLKTVTPFNFI